jgi:uncharacterized protein YcbK (DUF882 family)
MMQSKYFKRKEIACKCGCGFDTMDSETLMIADAVRVYTGKPLTCNSGARCTEHNKAVGGAEKSQHVQARAMDLAVENVQEVYDWLCDRYPDRYGFGVYNTFVHVDSRTNGPARWDNRS